MEFIDRCSLIQQSLAMALYFASRGIGKLHDAGGSDSSSTPPLGLSTTSSSSMTLEPFSSPLPPTHQPYKSPALVLLSGLGSDELLGGYSRHRVTWKKAGWEGLLDEVRRIILMVLGLSNLNPPLG